MYNLHTHTKRCLHAKGSDKEYVENAIKNGFNILGFSDHTPYIYPDGYYSGMRMSVNETPEYVESVNDLRKKYKDKVQILLGFEVEYYPALFENEIAFLKSFNYDYIILAQHFLDNEFEDGSIYAGAPSNDEKVLQKYVNQLLEGAKTGEFLYVAHPDLIKYQGDKIIYKDYMEYMLNTLKAVDLPIEFNFLGFSDKRNYPNKDFWAIASQIGNKAVIGIDAHEPKAFSQISKLRKANEYLESLGITVLSDGEILERINTKY